MSVSGQALPAHKNMKIKGFTLIEVLIATSIISVVFTTLVSIVATSLRDTTTNTKRIIGTHMSDALQEWIRSERDSDWDTFTTKTGKWCFNDEAVAAWPAMTIANNDACPYFTGSNNFAYKRIATITQDGDVYKSKIEFFWQDVNNTNTVTNETYYSQW